MDTTDKKQPLIVIAGATACGKTDTAIKLAKIINGEIISADSMQVYRYMDIGTAKPTTEQMQGIRHYLIDELDPDEDYSVAVFQKMAKGYIKQILSNKKIPILCGGTGFYINALIYDNDFCEEEQDLTLRNNLMELAADSGAKYLHDMLKAVDPDSANIIHQNNIKRTARALEFFNLTGRRISEHNTIEKSRQPFYDVNIFVLDMDREILYERIEKRVDLMLEAGLVGEVGRLLSLGYGGGLVSMQGIGYKEIVKYLEGHISLDEAVALIKSGTRHFAKRQGTWFRNQLKNGSEWIDVAKFNNACDLAAFIGQKLNNRQHGS